MSKLTTRGNRRVEARINVLEATERTKGPTHFTDHGVIQDPSHPVGDFSAPVHARNFGQITKKKPAPGRRS